MFLVALLVTNIIFGIIVKIYFKLTCGMCRSSRHLVGKVVVITGANNGIGYEAARDLAERGAKVIMGCRNETKAIIARDKIIKETGNTDIHYKHLDLCSLASVRGFAEDVIKTEKRLDILINNAGIAESENVKTTDGLSLIMQANHFGPFLLTNLLLPLIKSSAPSRIVNVSSAAHQSAKLDFQNLNFEKETAKSYNNFRAYQVTKLCNVLMTVELSRQLEGTGVTVNSLHPGLVATDILSTITGLWKLMLIIPKFFSKTPREGAQTIIYLAVSPDIDDVTGKYFADCREKKASKLGQDLEIAKKLWEASERLVKLK